MVKYVIFVSLLCLVFSCSEKVREDRTVLEKYMNGKDKKILISSNDGQKQHIVYYNEHGFENLRVQARDGLEQGIGIVYNESGDTASILNFKDGKYEGVLKWYDKSGCLRVAAVYKQDMLTGEEMVYKSNEILHEYIFHALDGSVKYRAYFDDFGVFSADSGASLLWYNMLSDEIEIKNEDTLFIGDTVILDIDVVRQGMRDLSGKLMLEVVDLAEDTKVSEEIDIGENHLSVQHSYVLEKQGKYGLTIYYYKTKISTGQTQVVMSDELILNVKR